MLSGDAPALAPELEGLMQEALRYHERALSKNTRRAYRSAWADFVDFCAAHDLDALPASAQTVALYLTERARRLAVSTLDQRLAAIQHVHDEAGRESPTRSRAIRTLMKGLRREKDTRPRKAKPLLTEDIERVVTALPGQGGRPAGTEAGATWLRGLRDRALLLVGYAGALRRSELAALRVEDVERRASGLLITVPASKTDQDGQGQLVAIREGSGPLCPASALWRWTGAAGIENGPLFRGVRRNGELRPGAVSGRTVRDVIRRAAERAGLAEPERYSGHSLRAGHITQAALNGVPDQLIMQQSRHESAEAFQGYVRPQRLLETTSSASLGL
jgi:integrase